MSASLQHMRRQKFGFVTTIPLMVTDSSQTVTNKEGADQSGERGRSSSPELYYKRLTITLPAE
jgi:hypothetical protein